MEDPISLSDTEDFSLHDNSLLQESKDSQEYLIMTIELGDGQQQHIKIHATDDPKHLAHIFMTTHNLSPELETSLASLIKQNLALLEKRSLPSPYLRSSGSYNQSLYKDAFQETLYQSTNELNRNPTINKKSEMITSKQSRSGGIHERLYMLALKKRKKAEQKSKALTEKPSASHFNTGEILYIKGISMKRKILKFTEEKNKEKQEKELSQLTFKPVINSTMSRYDGKTEDILLQKAKEYQQRKLDLKEKYDKEEVKDCYFRPNIHKTKDINLNVHEDLYREAQKRYEKQHEMTNNKQFSFRPNVEKPRTSNSESKEEFISRLVNSKKKLEEEMEKLRSIQEENYDNATGQKFFTPLTLGSHNVFQRKTGKKVWDYLYDLKDSKKLSIKNALEGEEKHWYEIANKIKPGAMSEKVFRRFRVKQLKKIFESMDSDKDGRISADNVNLNDMSEKMLDIISPLLEHLLNTGEAVDFKEFFEHMEELKNHLDVVNKNILFKREEKIEKNDSTAYPQLNPVTLEIAKKNTNDEGIYERQLKSKIINKLKLEKKKELQLERIVKDCSFKPKLIST